MTFALDTNTLSYYLRDEIGVTARLRATPPQELASIFFGNTPSAEGLQGRF